jgi:hypothetical protein
MVHVRAAPRSPHNKKLTRGDDLRMIRSRLSTPPLHTRSSLSRISVYWCRPSTKPPRPTMGTCTLLALAVHLTMESRDPVRLNLRQGGFGTG